MSANTWSQMFIPQQCLMKCSAVDLNRWKLCNSSDTVLVALFQYAFKTKPLKQWSWPVKRGQHIAAYIHKIQNKWSSFMFFGYSRTCQLFDPDWDWDTVSQSACWATQPKYNQPYVLMTCLCMLSPICEHNEYFHVQETTLRLEVCDMMHYFAGSRH